MKDLTIEYFTFSKKVNVGIVIDERNMTDAPPEDFPIRKRRGRPPKHARLLQFMESKAEQEQGLSGGDGGAGLGTRISLEPHEIKSHIHSSVTKNESSQRILVDPSKDQTITSVLDGVSSSSSSSFLLSNPVSSTATVVIAQADPASENNANIAYLPHVSTLPASSTSSSSNATSLVNTGITLPVKKRGGRKRKTPLQEGVPPPPPGMKKPRGRPKGSTNKPRAVTAGESLGIVL